MIAGVLVLGVLSLCSCGGGNVQSTVEPTRAPLVSPLPSQQAQPVPTNDRLAAEWKDGKISLAQIDDIIGSGLAQFIKEVTDDARRREVVVQKRRSVLDTLVENYLLIQEAHARNLQIPDAQKEQILKKARSNFNTKEEYEESLRKAGQTEDDLLKVLSNIELGRLCVEDERNKISETITPQTLKNFYEAHVEDRFSPPARSDINWVVIKTNEERTVEQAKEFINKLYAEVREKVQGLAKVAEKRKILQEYADKYSDDFSGQYNYGFMILYQRGEGWDDFDPEFRAEIEKRNKPGDLSDVVKVNKDNSAESSFAFFLVVNAIPASVSSFDSTAVQDMLPNMFIFEKMDQWRQQLKKNYGLKIYEENLSIAPETVLPASEP